MNCSRCALMILGKGERWITICPGDEEAQDCDNKVMMEEDKKRKPYYAAITEYTEEDLDLPFLWLELFPQERYKYIPDYQFVYWMTRYTFVMQEVQTGKREAVFFPPGLLKFLTDGHIQVTDRQRAIGKAFIDRMRQFLVESHTEYICERRNEILEKAEEFRERKKLDTITDALNYSGEVGDDEDDGKWMHFALLRYAKFEPRVTLGGRVFSSSSLIELHLMLQQKKHWKDSDNPLKLPDSDVTVRRRSMIGPFNWTAIKDHTPSCINPYISEFQKSLNVVIRYYERKARRGESEDSIDAGPAVDPYSGEESKTSNYDILKPNEFQTGKRRDRTMTLSGAGVDLYSWDNKVKWAKELRRRKKSDIEIAEMMNKKHSLLLAKPIMPEDIFDFFFKSDDPLWDNPRTGVLEHTTTEKKTWRKVRKRKDDKRLKRLIKIPWGQDEPLTLINKTGQCQYCGGKSKKSICWRCELEEDKWNSELDLEQLKLFSDHTKENVDPLKNRAWRGSFPLRGGKTILPLVFNRGDTVSEIRKYWGYLKAPLPIKNSEPVTYLSDVRYRAHRGFRLRGFHRNATIIPGGKRPPLREEIHLLQKAETFEEEIDNEEDFDFWNNESMKKTKGKWINPSPRHGSWWIDTRMVNQGTVLPEVFRGSPNVSSTRDIIDSPERVLYRIGKLLEHLDEDKMRSPLNVAWIVLNMYGNPYIRDISDDESGHFGYIPIRRLLLNYTRVNIGKKLKSIPSLKLGSSPGTMTTAFNILEESILNLPGNAAVDEIVTHYRSRGIRLPVTPLRSVSWGIDAAQNLESVSDNPPTITTPVTIPPERWRGAWNVSGMITVLYVTSDERRLWAQKELEIIPRSNKRDTRWMDVPWPKCKCGRQSIVKTTNGKHYCSEGHFVKVDSCD